MVNLVVKEKDIKRTRSEYKRTNKIRKEHINSSVYKRDVSVDIEIRDLLLRFKRESKKKFKILGATLKNVNLLVRKLKPGTSFTS